MIDCSDESCATAYDTLKKELASYSPELAAKPKMVLCNKIDVEGAAEHAQKIIKSIREAEKDTPVIAISVTANMNMRSAKLQIIDMVDAASGGGSEVHEEGTSSGSGASSFLSTRSVDESMEAQYPGAERS